MMEATKQTVNEELHDAEMQLGYTRKHIQRLEASLYDARRAEATYVTRVQNLRDQLQRQAELTREPG